MNRYDRANERLRAEHSASIRQTACGWTWGCSCGAEGKGLARMAYSARTAMQQHLRSQARKILEATT